MPGGRKRASISRGTGLRIAVVAVAGVAFAKAGLLACGGAAFRAGEPSGDAAPGPEDGDVSDASSDQQARPDAGPACPAGRVMCSGTCVTGNDCSTCAGANLFCRLTRTCAASCAGCVTASNNPSPIECFACSASQDQPIGTCEPGGDAAYCLNGNYSTAYLDGSAAKHCNCNNTDVANCPGTNQVCLATGGTDNCTTCGESATNGQKCKGGRTCSTALSPPRCQ